jgi:transcriptional regulator with XRE-family HTH domain
MSCDAYILITSRGAPSETQEVIRPLAPLPQPRVAYMLLRMSSAASLASRARQRAGLSARALAARAGVTPSTVTRIEQGKMDPTTTMLDRLLAAAGERLELSSHRSQAPWLCERAGNWPDIDWTWIRGVVDWTQLHPETIPEAISIPPHPDASPETKNLLAAIAEKIADDASLPRPRWTLATPRTRKPLKPFGTPRMVERGRLNAPEQFLKRNIWLHEQEFFRPR